MISVGINEDTVEAELEVKTYDIDSAGHVNNIVYVRWLEDLRTVIIEHIFDFGKIIAEGYYPVVISTTIRYRRQIKLFDQPTGSIRLAGVILGIFILKSEITVNESLCASAEQRCVIMRLCDSKILNGDDVKCMAKITIPVER
ncbi:MAG TPA: thioesterase family protein [Balneolales bacterium]|nr:thioesterase family protein [Balneolales bacterium]